MTINKFTISALCFFCLMLLAACDNGDDSEYEDIPNGGSAAPPSSPQPGGAISSLFFKSDGALEEGGILAIHPDNPANPVTVETGFTSGEEGIIDGKLDLVGQQITDIYIRTILYSKSNGRLYKVNALADADKTPVQVSNEIEASLICNHFSSTDHNDYNNSIYYYALPGASGECGSAEDYVWKMVRIGMDSSSSPILAKKPLDGVIGGVHDTTGAIVGFFAKDGQNIVYCDRNFNNCSSIISFVNSGEILARDYLANNVIIRADDKLYHYSAVNGKLSNVLHTLSEGSSFSSTRFGHAISDGVNLFFADGDKLYKLPMDGGAAPFLLATAKLAGVSMHWLSLTTNRVVYLTADSDLISKTLESVSKSGGDPATLRSFDNLSDIYAYYTAGEYIHYFTLLGTTVGTIKEDGSNANEIPNASPAGALYGSNQSMFKSSYEKILWIEGCSQYSNCSGGTLKAVDAATNSGEVVLGVVPYGTESILFSGYLKGGGALGMWDNTAAYKRDIFFVNPSKAGSLQRITSTPEKDEQYILP